MNSGPTAMPSSPKAPTPPAPAVLSDVFNERLSTWRDQMRTANRSPATIRNRTGAVEKLVITYDIPGGEATEDHVRAFLHEDDYMPWTVRTYLGHFRAWGRHLGIPDPTAQIPRPQSPAFRPRPIPELHLDHLIRDADPRMRLWTELGAHLGLKASETAGVHSRQFHDDPVAGMTVTLAYPNGTPAVLPVPQRIADTLRPHLRYDRPLFDVTPLYVSMTFHEHARACGYDYGYEQLRHRLGHTVYRHTRDVIRVQHTLRLASARFAAAYIAGADEP